MSRFPVHLRCLLVATFLTLLAAVNAPVLHAQETGSVTGRVSRASDGSPISGISVAVTGTGISTVTGTDGRYTLQRVPAGQQTLVVRQLGYRGTEQTVAVAAGATTTADIAVEVQPVTLAELVVSSASRVPERVVEAPAAVTLVDPMQTRDMSVMAQPPLALTNVPGVDVVQSGVNDFNVNARGFNSTLNRRVLVLQDGRDLAVAFLGSQEWGTMAIPMEDLGRVEMVRGPGSALYGANAFSGVLNILTPPARDLRGTKLTLAGGELSTFRGDLRHAGVFGQGRFGYRVNAGYARNESWTISRTRLDGQDFAGEYAEASDDPVNAPLPGFELRPLEGQSRDATTGAASGEPDDLIAAYGSARLDFYAPDGSIFTVDGGVSQTENEVAVTGIGRVQITKTLRPWARVGWAAENYNLMAWYSGRNTIDPQYSLASGLGLEETSAIFHLEGQYNRGFADDRARVVIGGSARNYQVDTKGTLMALGDDDRSDSYFAGYAQLEYKPTPELRIVAAGRVDDGDLYDLQFSPKGAIVFSPNERHSIRATVNRAFQVPNYSEFFLQANIPGDRTTSPALLEGGLETYFATVTNPAVVGPALAAAMAALNLPSNLPWNFDAETRGWALGNPTLEVERVLGWEIGYKGNLTDRAFVSVDLYLSTLKGFVTDLLPANALPCDNSPQYTCFALTDGGIDVPANLNAIEQILIGAGLPATHPLRQNLTALRGGYGQLNTQAGALLATMADGSTRALVVSYANAGEVREGGVEFGFGAFLTDEVKVEGSYTYFDFDIRVPGFEELVPNTPQHKATVSLGYRGRQGFDANVSARIVDGYRWAAGVFAGDIPSSQTINASASYAVNNNLRIHATATNVLNQKRYHLYGGSVIRRRVIGGITANF